MRLRWSALRLHRSFSTLKTKFKPVIGLEVHAQISSESKLFSAASVRFGAPVNSCVDEFDAAIPGTLPVLNKGCVEAAIKTGLALGCNINHVTMFDRKHYFYADMPSGYQITQQRQPIARNGLIQFPVTRGKKIIDKKSSLLQIQLEQDSGKSLHDDQFQISLVDLNRAGVPLMEFVFAPDLSDGSEAAALVKELALILARLNVCSCKMEEGALRVDANISVHKEGEPLGTRTEVKNIGSVRGVAQAVDYEIARQLSVLSNGGRITNETRSWDAVEKKTVQMRDKEVVLDYRFMPEPNLLPLRISHIENVVPIQESMPELPSETREWLNTVHHLTQEMAMLLVEDEELLQLFQKVLVHRPETSPKEVANLLVNEVRAVCNQQKISINDFESTHVAQIMEALDVQLINKKVAEKVLELTLEDKTSTVQEIVKKHNLQQIADEEVIEAVCFRVIEKNPKTVEQYKKGKEKCFFALAGQIATAEGGRINMNLATKMLRRLLHEK